MAAALTSSGFNLKPSVAKTASVATADSQRVLYFSNTQGYTQIVRQSAGGGEVEVVVDGRTQGLAELGAVSVEGDRFQA